MNEKIQKAFDSQKNDDESFLFGVKPQPGQFVVMIKFERYDGQMRWTAQIADASGQVVDVVRDPHAVTARFNTWMAGRSGAQIGSHMIVEYLRSRAFAALAKK